MSEKEKLGIIGFHAPGTKAFYTVQLPRWPNRGIAPMLNQNKGIAMNFVRNMMGRVDGGTPTMDGLMAALQYNVDAIILMTDGPFTDETSAYSKMRELLLKGHFAWMVSYND